MTPKPLTKPVATYGDWKVFADGEIRNTKHQLRMQPQRFREPDWCIKLHRNYPWMVEGWNTFMPAFFRACKLAGIEEVTIKIS